MSSIEEGIERLREEIRETPYNKSTEKHIGRLKARIAKLKEEKIRKAEKQGGGRGFGVEKSGDATVILVGFPSVGKSTLLNSLTCAEAEVADYDFTTLKVIPGSVKYKGANIQILDVPGIISGASEGRGRGREVISVMRAADLLLTILDPFKLEQYERIKEEIHDVGIRINERPPKVKIEKRGSGGLDINSTVELGMSEDEVRSIFDEYGIVNASVVIREELDSERLIDAIMSNRVYLPAIVVINKMDLVGEDRMEEVRDYAEDVIGEDVLYISAKSGELEGLKGKIFEELGLLRVYLKPRGEEADMEDPMILRRGDSVGDLCRKIHRDLADKFKYARVWGKSAKHPGQRVGRDHELSDEDIVTVVS